MLHIWHKWAKIHRSMKCINAIEFVIYPEVFHIKSIWVYTHRARADQSHRILSYQQDQLTEKHVYIKNSVECVIMLPVPFVLVFYLVYTLRLYNQIGHVKTDANNIKQNDFKFFDELACRPECRSMRVCSATYGDCVEWN